MLLIKVNVNLRQVDEVGIVNTGHRKKGLYLYRICHPEDYKDHFNHYEIWHNQKDPWPLLVGKVMEELSKDPEWFKERREKEDLIKEEQYIQSLLSRIPPCS